MRIVDKPSEPPTQATAVEGVGPITPRGFNALDSLPRRSITRRPPQLRLLPDKVAKKTETSRLITNEIEQIASTETLDFAFAVSELAHRLEGPVRNSGDLGAQAGWEALVKTAKMYEHLIVLQTEGAD